MKESDVSEIILRTEQLEREVENLENLFENLKNSGIGIKYLVSHRDGNNKSKTTYAFAQNLL